MLALIFFLEGGRVGGMAVTLRDYQAEAIDALYDWFGKHRTNPLIVVPTGGGKSVILAEFIRRVLAEFPRERILCVTHVKELIEQNEAAMRRLWPECPTGIYSAGIGRRDHDAQVVFAGVQSIYNRAQLLGWFDLAIVDEAHLIPGKGMGMYRTLFQDLTATNANLKVIGLTATPFRTGEGRLDEGDGKMFGGVAYNCEVPRLIRDGWLSNITNKGCRTGGISTEGVKKQGGDWIAKELQRAANQDDLVGAAVDEMISRGAERKSWLVFCCGIAHADNVAARLIEKGITCETVYGKTPKAERADTIDRFRRGVIRCVVNVNVLTTGFDAPNVDMIVMLRPTLSPVLYVQMVGRGLRIAPGKEDCLLLDFSHNVVRHGPINEVTIKEPKPVEKGSMPAKQCPVCEEIVPIGKMQCPACGYEWPVEMEPKHEDRPDETSEVVRMEKPKRFETYDVTGVSYEEWHSRSGENKPSTMRVTYWCGLGQQFSEWVCFNHTGYAQIKAVGWWHKAGGKNTPRSVDEAVVRATELHELDEPVKITVDRQGKYPSVVSVVWAPREPGAYEPDAGVGMGDLNLDDLPF